MRRIAGKSLALVTAALGGALLIAPAHAATIDLNTTVRDFCGWNFTNCPAGTSANPDFENVIADDRGIVETNLGGDGTPVYAGGAHSTLFGTDSGGLGSLTTKQYFDQWYHDAPGYNQSKNVVLTFTEMGSGVYEYNNSSFFPIDNDLLGNQGQSNNFAFTLQLSTSFTYQIGQTFSFTGDDDVWVYIDGVRVIDLGGVHGAETASVDLDTLGLTDGGNYSFDLFFAERHTTQSNLKIDTSIVFDRNPPTTTSAVPEPASIALFGAGLIGLGALRRKRRA